MASITANTSSLSSELAGTALNSLAAGGFGATAGENISTVDPLDVLVQVEITPGTVGGNKQALIFVQVSIDGTNYSTGPTSGTTATDEPNLFPLGSLPLNSNSTLQRGIYSMSAALGYIPPYFKIIVKNDSGAAFAASGHSIKYASQTGVST